MACGTPVIAYARGGATETVVPLGTTIAEPTGVWFAEQTVDCLAEALEQFETHRHAFFPLAARRQALRFNRLRFENELFGYLDAVLAGGSAVRQAAA